MTSGPYGLTVGANIRRLRKRNFINNLAGLSERLAATDCPIGVTALGDIERGDRRVDVDELVALAAALKSDVGELLGLDGGALDPDVESVAQDAHNLCLALREIDPEELLADIARMCARSPRRAAQVFLALAAWVDPEESLSVRGERVEAITRHRRAS